jgi:serine/threonine protein kinase
VPRSRQNPSRITYERGLSRFLDEARILAKFRHPHIVRVSRFVERHGTAYMIMDYEDGEPLSNYVQRGVSLPREPCYGTPGRCRRWLVDLGAYLGPIALLRSADGPQ